MPGHPLRSVALAAVLAGLLGCAGRGEPTWGGQWPDTARLREAAVATARDPRVWMPLAGAAALAVTDADDDLADWAADERPLFGADAESVSDDLGSAGEAVWLLTALTAPSPSLQDKAGGLLAGVVALNLEDAVTGAVKDVSGRRRPDGSDDESFSSGHAGTASVSTTMALANLDHHRLPRWADVSLRVGFHGIAAGTAWARGEARKHFPTDVLVGYAVGRFVGGVVQRVFIRAADGGANVSWRVEPLPGGGAVTLTLSPGR